MHTRLILLFGALAIAQLDDSLSLDAGDIASIQAGVDAQFPTIDIGDVAATVNSVLQDISSAKPSLTISTLPDYSDYAKSNKPTADVFTGPYVSDVVEDFSSFVETRTSGQSYSYQTPTLAPNTRRVDPTSDVLPSSTKSSTVSDPSSSESEVSPSSTESSAVSDPSTTETDNRASSSGASSTEPSVSRSSVLSTATRQAAGGQAGGTVSTTSSDLILTEQQSAATATNENPTSTTDTGTPAATPNGDGSRVLGSLHGAMYLALVLLLVDLVVV